MEIYVQSAGVSEEQDYCWQEIKDNSQEWVEEPGLVTDFKHLLQTESPSILIVRKNNQLILLVTGMKASKRKDYRGRPIRNSIAFIADDDESGEQSICGIAVQALRDELENVIDKLIVEGEKCGFKVAFKIFIQKTENTLTIYFKELDKNVEKLCVEVDTQATLPELKIGKNSKDNKEKIAQELTALKLPTIDQPELVVVTGIKAENTLTEVRVWRGLSNLVTKDELSPYEHKKKFAFKRKYKKSNNEKSEMSSKKLMALIIILPIFFVIFVLLITEPKNRETIAFALNIASKPNGQSVEIYKDIKNISAKDNVKEFTYEKVAVINPQNSQSVNNSNSQLFSLKHDAEVKSVAISADGQYVVTGDVQGKVWLWDANGNIIAKLAAHKQGVVLLAINVNSQNNSITVVSSDPTGEVNIWKPQINNKSEN